MILKLFLCFVLYLIIQIIVSNQKSKTKPLQKPSGNLLVFDTETNGLPYSWNSEIGDISNWPRMISIAWYCIRPDGQIVNSEYYIIKPQEYIISNSIEIHGITNSQALTDGAELGNILRLFDSHLSECKYVVAHNIDFDYPVLYCEYIRNGIDLKNLNAVKRICTMKQSTNYCKIPGKRGYKYPTLSELYLTIFSKPLTGVHNAQIDAEACLLCFKELFNRKVITF